MAELTETIKKYEEHLHECQTRRDKLLKSGKPDNEHYSLDSELDMLWCNIVMYSDEIAKMKQTLAEMNGESNMGERYEKRTFSNFNSENKERAYGICMRTAESIAKGEKKSLILMGNVGTGKTHLAASIANYCMEHGVVTKFGNITDIFQSLRNAFTKDEDILGEVKSVPLLVLDDLGKEYTTEWTNETIYSIINYRYEHMLSTVVTTNLTLAEMQEKIGEATVSRLMEMCEYVSMDGKDYRMGA